MEIWKSQIGPSEQCAQALRQSADEQGSVSLANTVALQTSVGCPLSCVDEGEM